MELTQHMAVFSRAGSGSISVNTGREMVSSSALESSDALLYNLPNSAVNTSSFKTNDEAPEDY